MPSLQEHIDAYMGAHDELTEAYYAGEQTEALKRTFDIAHAKLWTDHEAALVAEGHSELPGPTLEERVKSLEDKQIGEV